MVARPTRRPIWFHGVMRTRCLPLIAWLALAGCGGATATPSAPAAPVTVTLPLAQANVAAPACAPSMLDCSRVPCLFVDRSWGRDDYFSSERACNTGSRTSCAAAAIRLTRGDGVQVDRDRARDFFQRACTAKIPLACLDDALLGDKTRLFDVASTLCDAGTGDACYEAGMDIGFGAAATTHSPAERAAFFTRACDLGNAGGCMRLAFHYGTGLGVTKNDAKSYELASHACSCGDDLGCSAEADLLRLGLGVAKNTARAFTILETLCAEDVGASCVHLGRMYALGEHGAPDLAKARSLYADACAGRERNPEGGSGCVQLGNLYFEGTGADADDAKAASYYDLACRSRVAAGCGHLARMLRAGRGITADPGRANALAKWACDHGDAKVCDQTE